MAGRSDVVIPRGLLGGLTYPSNSIVDGSFTRVFLDVNCLPEGRRMRWSPSVRLPVCARTAWRFRAGARYDRLDRAVLFPLAVALTVVCVPLVLYDFVSGGNWVAGGGAVHEAFRFVSRFFIGLTVVELGARYLLTVGQHPRVSADGDVRIAGMPGDLAAEWAALNPGITVVPS